MTKQNVEGPWCGRNGAKILSFNFTSKDKKSGAAGAMAHFIVAIDMKNEFF